MPSRCRIYLLTYRQPKLLVRALQSIVRQTFTDWVCEIHNDDPTDSFPDKLAAEVNDRRITVVNHPVNLGGTKAFNLVFRSVEEPYVTLLEDDNWWEPNYLRRLIEVMDQHPAVNVIGSNACRWRMESDATWTQLETFVPPTNEVKLCYWPVAYILTGNRLGNAALLCRSANISDYIVPEETSLAATESVRERAFPHPFLFLTEPLGNFACRPTTNRSSDQLDVAPVLLVASIFELVPFKEATLRDFWQSLGGGQKNRDSWFRFFFAGMICPKVKALTKFADTTQRATFIAYCLRHPKVVKAVSRSRTTHSQLWSFLMDNTAKRLLEAQARGFDSL